MHSLPTFEAQSAQAMEALRRLEPSLGEARLILSPYRICPLGGHVDHQGGSVLGRTIAAGTVLATHTFRPSFGTENGPDGTYAMGRLRS